MAGNYVEIKVRASDTAKPDLTDLKLRLDELGHKVETAKVDVDDEDAAVKLLRLNAKLADLNAKVANPRIKVAGAARAEAEILALNHELGKLDRKAATAGPTGLLGRILTGVEGAGGGGGGGGVAGMLPGGPALAGLAAAIPLVGALAVEVTGLVSGFAAAGAGAGAFGLLAMPAFKSVSGALTQVKADQAAYDRALTKTAKNNALKHLQEDYAKLDPAQRTAVKGIQQLSSTFGEISKAFEPQAFKIFNDGLKIANDLLPALAPMATAFANALDPLLKRFDKFTQSKGFQDWLKKFTSNIGPAMTAIGNGLAKAGPALGKFLTMMSRKDIVNAINIAFSVLAVTLTLLAAGIKRFMENWDQMSSAFRRTRHDIASAGHDIAHVFDDIRHAVASFAHEVARDFDDVRHFNATLAHDFAHAFDTIRHAAATLAHNIAAWFDRIRHSIASKFDQVVSFIKGVPHRIVSALGNLGSLLFNAGKAIIQGLINGIKSMFGALGSVASSIGHFIAGLKGPIPADLLLLVPHGQAIMTGLMNGMGSKMPQLKSHLAGISGTIAGIRLPGGAAGGGGALHLQVTAGGGSAFEQFMVQAIRNYVRIRGGNVQGALGH